MSQNFKPSNSAEVEAAVKWAAAEREPLQIAGQNSKRSLGRPVQAARVLSLSDLSGVTLYEPEELILSAKAGTPIADIESLLEDNGQELAFEPMDPGPMLGAKAGQGTLGGIVATNLSGPRRLKAGAARDHILGIEAVSGRGEIYKAGGRVVKNVTGYDLARGLAGSWGTLSVLTEITLKVMPRAETEETLVLSGLDDRESVEIMSEAMGSSAEVSSAAYVPADGTKGKSFAGFDPFDKSVTALRVEGFGSSVSYRLTKLRDLFRSRGDIEILDEQGSRSFWRDIRDVTRFADMTEAALWKVSVAPTAASRLMDLIRQQTATRFYFDWGGGLIWLCFEDQKPRLDMMRKAVANVGGHATLMRASEPVRSASSVFQPQPEALAALTRRLKAQFDPHGILNPGRMYAGV